MPSVVIDLWDGLTAMSATASHRTFEGLRREAQRIIEETIETDRREDELYGQRRGDDYPASRLTPRRARRGSKELLEQARAEREAAPADGEQLIAGHEQHLARTGKRKRVAHRGPSGRSTAAKIGC
jgi:hypothetical protein